MAGVDLFASSAGLDAAQSVAGSDLFADPNAPGPFKKGVKTSAAGLKQSAAGALALIGDISGIESLKQFGLQNAQEAQEQGATTAMRVEDIDSASGAIDYAKFGTGYLVPQLATAVGAGLLGRVAGAAAARGLADPAKALLAKNAGMTAGLAASSITQEAGAIYPEAVEAGLDDAVARAVIGGAVAGSVDLVPELLAAKMLGVFGKRQVNPAKGLTEILAGGAKGAGAGLLLEGATEGAQTAIERLAVNKPLTGEEARSEFINSIVLGALGGTIVGGGVGAASRLGSSTATTPPVDSPATTPTVAQPEVVSPAPTPAPEQPAPSATPFPQIDETVFPTVARDIDTGPFLRPFEGRDVPPAPVQKTRLTEGVVLGEQPQRPGAATIITPQEDDMLRLAEKEARNAARQGSFKGSIQQERGRGEAQRQTDGSSGGNRVLGAAQGEGQVFSPGSESSVEARLGLIKRQRGLLLSADEAKAVRAFEKSVPSLVVESSTARETTRYLTPEARREAFLGAYDGGVKNIIERLSGSGAMKPNVAKNLSTRLRVAVEQALKQPDVTAAANVFNVRFDEALSKSRLPKGDIETFRNELTAFVSENLPREMTTAARPLRSLMPEKKAGLPPTAQQGTLFNKGATNQEVGVVEFTHWGNVPTGLTSPSAMGRGVKGADWEPAGKVGIHYTSAVVKGSPYVEPAVQGQQQYEGSIPADKVYVARSDDPLLAQARAQVLPVHGPNEAIAWMQYAKNVRDLGYEAILYNNGQLRIFTPQHVAPVSTRIFRPMLPALPESALDQVPSIIDRHLKFGGSTTVISTGQDMMGAQAYAVSIFKDRELVVLGNANAPTVAKYIRANDDLLSDPRNALGTWFNNEDGNTYLDISVLVPRMQDALQLARKHGQIAIFDLRTGTNIPLGHPLFDVAQQYNAEVGLPPIQEVEYLDVDPVVGKQIARAYDKLQKFNPDPRVKKAFDAMAREEERQFDMISQHIKIEPWRQPGQPYKNSAEMRADVFGNNHLWVFEGGEEHPLRTPEQVYRGRAVHDLFAHARTGFEFGPRGELNATRVHAQMYSEEALPALIVDNIGQNMWVNFSDANEGLPADQRAFAEQKVDILPESTWRDLLAESRGYRSQAIARRDAILTEAGRDALEYLRGIIGAPERVEVRLVDQLPVGVGAIHFRDAQDVIELAMNAKDIMSVAAHEGFHYLEIRVLGDQERSALAEAFKPGAPAFENLIEKVRAYDKANGSNIEAEVRAIPQEARAYGYEFWSRGELKAQGMVERAFRAIQRVIERVRNWFAGRGFTSYDDIFEAIERGWYSRYERNNLRIGTVDQSFIDAVEPDALPGGASIFFRERKAASRAKGRPDWIKSPADLAKMRKLLRALTKEGEPAKNWYRRSGQAILAWAGGDKERAAKMAALVAMYSPRTPVGDDLRHAVQHFAQWEAKQPINPGGTKRQAEYGTQILDGTGHRDYLDKYVLPGHPDTAPKITSFFKNLMQTIDPVSYPPESQDSTIDMWMSHIFGFGSKDGKLSTANYWWADAEIKKLAADMGVAPDQAQAAIWVAIKARGNMVRQAARKEGIARGWFEKSVAPENKRSDLFGSGGRVQYKLKKQHEFDYMVNWIRLALSVPFSKANFDTANYSYAEAFRDIADGSLALNRLDFDFEIEAGLFDDIAFGKVTQGALTFYSQAASIGEMAQRMAAGELPRSQLNVAIADALDQPSARDLRDNFLSSTNAELQGAVGGLKRFYAENLSSGLNLARRSIGYGNVFRVLTAYTQRKNRLIADGVERQLSEWTGRDAGTQDDKIAVSKALLQRTENSWTASSPQLRALRESLTPKQRAMFDQATRMIGNQLDAELKADAATYRALFNNDEQFAQWYTDRAAQVQRLKEEGYMPERRYGDHVVHAYVEGEGGKRVTVYYSQHEREADARTELAELQQNLGEQGLKFEYGYRYRADYDGSISFQQFLDMASRHGVKLTQQEKERIGKALISADSMRRNRIFRRKNVAGYSEDGMRVLAEFGVTMANKVAYAELGTAINDALAGREIDVKFTPQGEVQVNTYTNRNMWDMDGEQGGFYRNVADQTVDFVMSPQSRSKLSRGLRTAASLQFLGGSVAAALVNMTSIPMNTIPWLTQHTSYTDAFAKTLGAARLTTKHLSTIKDLPKLLDQSVQLEGIDEVDGLRRALQTAAQDGTILDTEIYQIMGLSRGQEYSLSGRAQKAVTAWMLPFRLAEQFNRVTTFISAYNIAKQKNMTNEQAYKLAQDTVYATQFRYDEANRPALARGDIGSLLFTFKTYPIFVLETLTYLAKEKPSAAVFMTLALLFMAGVEGLPFVEDIEDIVDTVAQRVFGSPFNSKRALRNVLKSASEAVVGADLSSVLMHGVANELTGLSFASRVGLGNLLPGTRLGAADADYKKVVSEIFGPVGSLIEGAVGAADSMSRGQYVQAAKQVLPLAGQNLIKGWEQWEKGFATDLGGRKLVDVDGPHAFWQSLGFSSSALAQAYETDKIDRQVNAFYTQAKQDIERDIIKAVRDNKPEALAEVVAAIEAWNRTHPEMPMALSPAAIRKQIVLGNMPMNQRTFKLLPKALRSQSESALGFVE